MFDNHINMGYSTVLTAPSPASSGTTLVLATGGGALMPPVPFNATVWPQNTGPLLSNAEIVRVTNIVGDTLTIVRTQEGTSARAITVGDQFANTITKKVLTDVEDAINALPQAAIQSVSAGTAVATGPQLVFANSPSVSFGVNGNTVTASAAGGGGGNINLSAGSTSNNLTAFTLADSNGIRFGLNAGVVTAGGLLSMFAVNNTTQSSSGTADITALSFGGAGIASVGITNGSVIISVPAGGGGGDGGNTLAAGTRTAGSNSIVLFSNANGATFGLDAVNGSIMTLSYTVPTVTNSSLTVSDAATSGTLARLAFTNLNGVTLSLSTGAGGSHTIVGSHNALTSQSSMTVSDAATSGTLARLAFTNLNGVTLSLSTGAAGAHTIVGSHNALTSQSNQAFSASGGSTTFQTLNFVNGNGLTFTNNAGSVGASYTVPTVTNSSLSISDAATSGTLARLAFTNLNGVTLSLSTGAGGSHTIVGSHNALTSQSSWSVSDAATSGTVGRLAFTNLNGVTLSLSTGAGGSHTIVGSHNALTSQTNQTLGLYASSNTTGAASSTTADARSLNFVAMGVASVGMSGGSIVISVPSGGGAGDGGNTIAAGTRTAGSNSIVLFSNLNGLTWGLDAVNGSIMTASYTVPTVTNSSMTVSDAATSGTLARLAFTNLNGVTLSLSTGAGGSHTIVGSHNALTSQSNQAFSASGGSTTFQTLNFVNGNGLTFTNNAGSVGASYTVPTVTNSSWSVSDAATSGTVGRLAFTNLNGVTLSLSTGAGGSHTIVGSHNALTSQSNQAFTAGGGSSAFQTLAFADTNGISFTNTNGSVGVAAAKLSMYAVSNTTQSTSGTANITALSFGGAGIASVGITNGSVIISVPAGGGGGDGYNIVSLATSTYGGGTGGATFSTLSGSIGFHAGSNITISQTSNSIIFYGPTGGAGGGAAIGVSNIGNTTGNTGTFGTGTVVFAGGSGITLSQATDANGATISFNGPSITQLSTQNRPLAASTVSTQGNNSVWIAPFRIGNYVSASTMVGIMSFTGTATSNQTNTAGVTLEYALYTAPESNQSSFSQLWSTTLSGQVWNSGTVSASWAFNGSTSSSAGTALLTQFHGLRLITNTINSTLNPGLYAYGFRFSSSTAGNSSIMRTCAPVMDNPLPVAGGYMGAATNASIGYADGGTWSVTSATLPATFNLTDVKQTNNAMPFVKIGAI